MRVCAYCDSSQPVSCIFAMLSKPESINPTIPVSMEWPQCLGICSCVDQVTQSILFLLAERHLVLSWEIQRNTRQSARRLCFQNYKSPPRLYLEPPDLCCVGTAAGVVCFQSASRHVWRHRQQRVTVKQLLKVLLFCLSNIHLYYLLLSLFSILYVSVHLAHLKRLMPAPRMCFHLFFPVRKCLFLAVCSEICRCELH